MRPTTQYAKSGDIHIAYQLFGTGPVNLVFVPGFISHIENYWDEPGLAKALDHMGTYARVVMFDKRGTGLSDPVNAPTMDERMDDIRAVMDAVNFERAAIFAISEGGSLACLFAAHHPDRCQSLLLYGAFARFSSWFTNEEALEGLFSYIDEMWGTGNAAPMFNPSLAGDAAFQTWFGKFERLGATPGAAKNIMRLNSEIDVTDILSSVRVPTGILHRTDDILIDVEGGRELAQLIPNATLREFSGSDHFFSAGDNNPEIQQAIEEFITGAKSEPVFDRVLATVLFTDIVNSSARADDIGDAAWRQLLEAHDSIVRSELSRYRGNEIKSLGDGFLATFDGPARAIKCAQSIRSAVQSIGIEIRAGLHTGEVEIAADDVRGIGVHIAARVSALANSNEVLVSRTVKDLVVGSGIAFEDRGTHELKGISDDWRLFRVSG